MQREGEKEKCGARNETCQEGEKCQKIVGSIENDYKCVATKIEEGKSCNIQSDAPCEQELECELLSDRLNGTCVQLQMEGKDCTEEIYVCKNWKDCRKYEKSTDFSQVMKCANGLQCLVNDLSTKKVIAPGKCFRTGKILYLKCLLDMENMV